MVQGQAIIESWRFAASRYTAMQADSTMCARVHIYICLCICVYVYMGMCVCIYIFFYLYMYMYIQMFIYIGLVEGVGSKVGLRD